MLYCFNFTFISWRGEAAQLLLNEVLIQQWLCLEQEGTEVVRLLQEQLLDSLIKVSKFSNCVRACLVLEPGK
jgi:hypothetical protein